MDIDQTDADTETDEGPGPFVAAIDQGTTGTRCLIFDAAGHVRGQAYRTHEQYYPNPGWVEHDPLEILENARRVTLEALSTADVVAGEVDAIGITNQRETTVLWDADTGEPVHDAIVWQDRRTTDRIEAIEAAGDDEWIRERTGLVPDAYFSATKLEWLLDTVDSSGERSLRTRAEAGEVLFGTIDAWLVHCLTGVHATDVTNAARTMLFDIETLEWDDRLLETFGVPEGCLPEVLPSTHPTAYGATDPDGFLGARVPVTGVLGDQQAALFGQTCFDRGDAKNTYGTGSFFLLNTGTEPARSDRGLLTTVAYQRHDQPPTYALEGSIFTTGAAIEWLVDVGLIDDPDDTERLAAAVDSTDDVFVVPAFSGLGAPHWDGRARGTIVGLTRGTSTEHLVRATLEAIGFRTRDVVTAMEADAGVEIAVLRVDGGSVHNDVLCRLLADVNGVEVVRPDVDETTALGAAYAAGLGSGVWETLEDLRERRRIDTRFDAEMDAERRDALYERWEDAIERARNWAES